MAQGGTVYPTKIKVLPTGRNSRRKFERKREGLCRTQVYNKEPLP